MIPSFGQIAWHLPVGPQFGMKENTYGEQDCRMVRDDPQALGLHHPQSSLSLLEEGY